MKKGATPGWLLRVPSPLAASLRPTPPARSPTESSFSPPASSSLPHRRTRPAKADCPGSAAAHFPFGQDVVEKGRVWALFGGDCAGDGFGVTEKSQKYYCHLQSAYLDPRLPAEVRYLAFIQLKNGIDLGFIAGGEELGVVVGKDEKSGLGLLVRWRIGRIITRRRGNGELAEISATSGILTSAMARTAFFALEVRLLSLCTRHHHHEQNRHIRRRPGDDSLSRRKVSNYPRHGHCFEPTAWYSATHALFDYTVGPRPDQLSICTTGASISGNGRVLNRRRDGAIARLRTSRTRPKASTGKKELLHRLAGDATEHGGTMHLDGDDTLAYVGRRAARGGGKKRTHRIHQPSTGRGAQSWMRCWLERHRSRAKSEELKSARYDKSSTTARMSVTNLLCNKLGFHCHTTMVPLEMAEMVDAFRSIAQELAGTNEALTLIIAFAFLMVLALLTIIAIGLTDGDVRGTYCARLAVIGASINGAAHYVSTTFTALGVPAAASRLTATLVFYCSNAAHWTADSVSSCRNVLAERFVDFTNTSNSAAQKPGISSPEAEKENEKDIQIGWNMQKREGQQEDIQEDCMERYRRDGPAKVHESVGLHSTLGEAQYAVKADFVLATNVFTGWTATYTDGRLRSKILLEGYVQEEQKGKARGTAESATSPGNDVTEQIVLGRDLSVDAKPDGGGGSERCFTDDSSMAFKHRFCKILLHPPDVPLSDLIS
ncbi:uncharacterized protein MYCGRDRAFT_97979 [Zymoseptoria tritici IPO323]|uniref:Uncharacterized protein n=1 Tax=Zymoseptoria tritici (strain CBS 115943 / IPO323) TaxID=336722 RepID=F9XRY6_ZYMTI|nr:uncharacterized protein MYCGRDRAFT_97979 [Zymoseptoria tritici IPO323]EGP82001.1 hypothetical protein MYCGRDRAFT_97979 [Zymoseptoria tritici IPO323]